MGTTMTYTQDNRPIAVTTPLGKDKLLLASFSGVEEISAPFRFTLQMVSPEAELSSDKVLGKGAHITVKRHEGEGERYYHGIIRRFVQLGRDTRSGLTTYEAELVPELWLLSLGSDCRIFQEKNGLAVIEQVFSDVGLTNYAVRCNTAKSAPPREYCVQYRETHLQFVSRIMEEEGIFYYFEHTADKHTLVLADEDTKVESCPGAKTLHMSVSTSQSGVEEVATELQSEFSVTSKNYTIRDYNYETSTTQISSVALSAMAKRVFAGEPYDYPGKVDNQDEAGKEAARRLDRLQVQGAIVRGWSNCPALTSGYQTSIADHYRSDLNAAYRLLRVEHYASSGGFAAGDDAAVSYRNGFVGVRADAKYLPPQVTPKPVVHGSQTAVVVGKAGEEIWTDKEGRVKVQFFWDRKGKNDDKSSCWVRVSSLWAGKGFGWVHIPRIGEEVVVDFLEGDPDRPLITGRVYNDKHVPPWPLPGEQTRAGLRTRSSKQGGEKNYNELYFEDKKGSEMVFLHAERGLTTEVEVDEVRTVGNSRTTTIEKDETKTVNKGDEQRTVKKGDDYTTIEEGDQLIAVNKGDQSLKVYGTQMIQVMTGDQNIKLNQGKQVTELEMGDQFVKLKQGSQITQIDMGDQDTALKLGNKSVVLDLGKISYEAMQSIELKVGQSSIKIDQMGVTISGMMIKIEGQIETTVKGLITQVTADAMLKAGGAITMIGS